LLAKLALSGLHGIITLIVKHSPALEVLFAFGVLYQWALL